MSKKTPDTLITCEVCDAQGSPNRLLQYSTLLLTLKHFLSAD